MPGAALTNITSLDAHDGVTSRQHWALDWNDAGRSADLPGTVFVKTTPEAPYLRESLAVLHMHENEVNFFNLIQPELPDLAPEGYYAKSYPGEGDL